MRTKTRLAALVLLTTGALTGAFVSGRFNGASGADPRPDTNAADREAIRKATDSFLKAFEGGDAKAVAGHWTTQGEYITGDGTTLRGRAAIAKAYARHFAKNPGLKLEVHVDGLRFVSHDAAIEEGYARAVKGKGERGASSRYSILHVRENGRWLMAVLREWPDEGAALRDLDWLIGTWTAKKGDAEVSTTYKWDEGKKFIRVQFTIKDKETRRGTQRIGLDPRTGQLRSWLFESAGGFGEAVWSRDGKKWLLEAKGVQEDGSEISATNILTPLDKDSFTWQSTNRIVDGEEMPDLPPVKVTRVK